MSTTMTNPTQRRAPVITRARDTSSLSSFIVGKSGVGKTHIGTTIPNSFFLAVEEGLKGCAPGYEPDHFEEEDLPQTLTALMRLIDIFLASNIPPAGATGKDAVKPWRHLVLDTMSGIEKLCYLAAIEHHRVKDMEGKEYKAVWSTGFEMMQDVQRKLDVVRRSGVNVWILAHAVETYEAIADTGITFKRWDMQFRGSEKHVQEVKLLWRGWADQVLFLDWAGETTKAGKGARTVGRLKGRVLYTRETGTHAAKTRLKLPAMVPATWEDLARAIREGVVGNDTKIRADIEKILPLLGERRAEIAEAMSRAKGPNGLAAVLSRAQGILAVLEDEADDDAPPADPTPTPPAAVTAPAAGAPAFTAPEQPVAPATPSATPADPTPTPPAATSSAPSTISAPSTAETTPAAQASTPSFLNNDDEAAARAVVNGAHDRPAIAKALTDLSRMRLHPDVRKALREELLTKRDGLPHDEARK